MALAVTIVVVCGGIAAVVAIANSAPDPRCVEAVASVATARESDGNIAPAWAYVRPEVEEAAAGFCDEGASTGLEAFWPDRCSEPIDGLDSTVDKVAARNIGGQAYLDVATGRGENAWVPCQDNDRYAPADGSKCAAGVPRPGDEADLPEYPDHDLIASLCERALKEGWSACNSILAVDGVVRTSIQRVRSEAENIRLKLIRLSDKYDHSCPAT